MKAFVTGGTGLLGSNLVELLSRQGYEVVALARSREKAQKILGHLDKVTVVQGDMENIAGFADALTGCDFLFHTAAYFREYYDVGDHWETLEKINITGTIDLLTVAEQKGVKKAVHTSSSGVIGSTTDGSDPDESTAADQYVLDNLYFKSKLIAEEKIQAWQKTHTMPVIIVNPTGMYGPGDAAPTSAGKIILDFIHGSLPAIPPGGFNVVDARDVAQAMIVAIDKAKAGERYILNNGYYSVHDLLKIIGRVTGLQVSNFVLPYSFALLLAYGSEFVARLTHTKAIVPLSGIKTLNYYQTANNNKAKQELDFKPRPFEQTIQDEIQWYLDNGYITKDLALKSLSQTA